MPQSACPGDCRGDGQVTVDEILALVKIALGQTTLATCPSGDIDDNGDIGIDEILAAVRRALEGC
ncbi:MAG: hypothetical protein HY270_05355 [Deltaproteobacteria bacterium]|nr:hypothetical protein [Deltaproteobacteria bacterium]